MNKTRRHKAAAAAAATAAVVGATMKARNGGRESSPILSGRGPLGRRGARKYAGRAITTAGAAAD